ncbi:acyclic terpene utilization AtuA family protein [Eisenibacter elegans]|uniref:acyclic terpene utilization AtuA family protein n=1 Tax=Eisenibacter elegans TaxID=997 RepID=UPI000416488F|nr:acyclic terpene utilization AtuA family protein [Eisenibacter elegans]
MHTSLPNTPVRIAGGQGFYGDSPQAAIAIAKAKAADYIMMDALAELTLSILQKDKQRDTGAGYARDIDFLAKSLYPLAYRQGIKIVSSGGGLNPWGAAERVVKTMRAQGIEGFRVAVVTGDDFSARIDELRQGGELLQHLDSGEPFDPEKYRLTHANVYTGAAGVAEALSQGADLVLTGRVADPALVLGILVHHYGWTLDDAQAPAELDLLAAGIVAGHVIECGGQASGGNSYAEFPPNYSLHNLAYPIAEIWPDGRTEFTRLTSQGGKVSRNTIREQLVYEIHNPAAYITPDVTADLTQIQLEQIAPDRVRLTGVKGNPRPEKLKLAMGYEAGYLSEQLLFFTAPYAVQKARLWEDAVRQTWVGLPMLQITEAQFQYIGIDGIHPGALPPLSPEQETQLREVGLRIAIRHPDEQTGKQAFQATTCLGLNGPPGVCSMPGWGKINRQQLALFPTLIDRRWVATKVEMMST